MILQTTKGDYTLRLKCRDFRALKEKLAADDLIDSIMSAAQNSDVDTLAVCISIIAEPKLTPDEAYDVLDEYLAKEENTVLTFGTVLLEVLDNAGFLPKKGIAMEITKMLKKELGKLNVLEMMREVEKQEEEPEEEPEKQPKPFKGHKA